MRQRRDEATSDGCGRTVKGSTFCSSTYSDVARRPETEAPRHAAPRNANGRQDVLGSLNVVRVLLVNAGEAAV